MLKTKQYSRCTTPIHTFPISVVSCRTEAITGHLNDIPCEMNGFPEVNGCSERTGECFQHFPSPTQAIMSSLQAHATQSPKNLGEKPEIKGYQTNPTHFCVHAISCRRNRLNDGHACFFACRGFVCSEVLRLDAKKVLSSFQPAFERHTNPM
jgi:hypothetical protein